MYTRRKHHSSQRKPLHLVVSEHKPRVQFRRSLLSRHFCGVECMHSSSSSIATTNMVFGRFFHIVIDCVLVSTVLAGIKV